MFVFFGKKVKRAESAGAVTDLSVHRASNRSECMCSQHKIINKTMAVSLVRVALLSLSLLGAWFPRTVAPAALRIVFREQPSDMPSSPFLTHPSQRPHNKCLNLASKFSRENFPNPAMGCQVGTISCQAGTLPVCGADLYEQ